MLHLLFPVFFNLENILFHTFSLYSYLWRDFSKLFYRTPHSLEFSNCFIQVIFTFPLSPCVCINVGEIHLSRVLQKYCYILHFASCQEIWWIRLEALLLLMQSSFNFSISVRKEFMCWTIGDCFAVN